MGTVPDFPFPSGKGTEGGISSTQLGGVQKQIHHHLLCTMRSCYFPISSHLSMFDPVCFRNSLSPPPPKKRKKKRIRKVSLPWHSCPAPLQLPFSSRGARDKEKDSTRYLCLFIYSVNSFCAGALKRHRMSLHRNPSVRFSHVV